VTGSASPADLLVLHGLRVLGGPSLAELAELYDLDRGQTSEVLLDAQAYGWATTVAFFGRTTWSLTGAGKREEERRLQAELDRTATRHDVAAAHTAFLPLNERHGRVCTDWQLRPTLADSFAANDHTDRAWDRRVLDDLVDVATGLDRICARLAGALSRFGVHAPRYRTALDRALAGDAAWVNSPDHPSCQIVWIQLHEDLLATLGIPRVAVTQ
jgi:hypothetical protein